MHIGDGLWKLLILPSCIPGSIVPVIKGQCFVIGKEDDPNFLNYGFVHWAENNSGSALLPERVNLGNNDNFNIFLGYCSLNFRREQSNAVLSLDGHSILVF